MMSLQQHKDETLFDIIMNFNTSFFNEQDITLLVVIVSLIKSIWNLEFHLSLSKNLPKTNDKLLN